MFKVIVWHFLLCASIPIAFCAPAGNYSCWRHSASGWHVYVNPWSYAESFGKHFAFKPFPFSDALHHRIGSSWFSTQNCATYRLSGSPDPLGVAQSCAFQDRLPSWIWSKRWNGMGGKGRENVTINYTCLSHRYWWHGEAVIYAYLVSEHQG